MIEKSITANFSKEIYNFTQKFKKTLSVPNQKNLREILRGIILTGSTHLAKISRVSKTGNRERSDITRFSTALEKIDAQSFHNIHITHTLKNYTQEPTLFFSDGGDIQKPAAQKMEKVCSAIDGNNGHRVGKGFPAHSIVAYGVQTKTLRPLSFHLYSTKEEEFKSEFTEQKKIFSLLSAQINTNIKPSAYDRIIIEDRGCDSQNRFLYFLKDLHFSFITRINTGVKARNFCIKTPGGNFFTLSTQQILKNQKKKIFDKKQNHIQIPQNQKRTWYNKKIKKNCESIIDVQEVYLPQHKNIPLYLISVFTEGYKDPLCVLTDLTTDTLEKAWKYFFFYKKRWEVENLFRSMKQNFDLEKFQILSFKKIKALTFLVLLAKDFLSVLQSKIKDFLNIFYKIFTSFCKNSQRSGTHHLDLLAFIRAILPVSKDGYSYHFFSSYFHNIRNRITSNQCSLFDFRKKC